jgi:hypothetical protein
MASKLGLDLAAVVGPADALDIGRERYAPPPKRADRVLPQQ